MAQATERSLTADACNALQRVRLMDHHRATVQRIYDYLDAPVEVARGHAPSGRGKVTVGYAKSYGLGTIHVSTIGADTAMVQGVVRN